MTEPNAQHRPPAADREPPIPSFPSRLVLAWIAFFRILFDGPFAGRVLSAHRNEPPLLPPRAEEEAPKAAPVAKPAVAVADLSPALQLLALFQREGRFIDFLEEDVTAFSDADVGAAARVVHDGCRKALRDHARLVAVRAEQEGARITVGDEVSRGAVKLVGNVSGSAPFTGVLRHRGHRIEGLELPTGIEGHDPRIVAPAEVEV